MSEEFPNKRIIFQHVYSPILLFDSIFSPLFPIFSIFQETKTNTDV